MRKVTPSAIRVENEVAYVHLGGDLETIIDIEDIPLVDGAAWRPAFIKGGHVYAVKKRVNGDHYILHRLLLNAEEGRLVDHADRDGLNNRRSNIRLCTSTENMANRLHDRRNLLGIKGVSKARSGRYRASIQDHGRRIELGYYDTPEEASAAYYGAARALWGDFAKR